MYFASCYLSLHFNDNQKKISISHVDNVVYICKDVFVITLESFTIILTNVALPLWNRKIHFNLHFSFKFYPSHY